MSWIVFEYERHMALALWQRVADSAYRELEWDLRNAVVECLVLHTRVLVDILISKDKNSDDITLSLLLPTFTSLAVDAVMQAYGTAKRGGCPCWQFNKLMAHPTTHRSINHDYVSALKQVWVTIAPLLVEIDAARADLAGE